MLARQPSTKLICFYADEDEVLWDQLKNHLKPLEQSGLFSIWDQRQIPLGANWTESINEQFLAASIVLLLLSSDFLADHEDLVQMALWNRRAGVQIVPVLLRSCAWQSAGFGTFQILPKNQRPIRRWPDQDAALEEVTQAIRDLVVAVPARPVSDSRRVAVPLPPETTRTRRPLSLVVLLAILALVVGSGVLFARLRPSSLTVALPNGSPTFSDPLWDNTQGYQWVNDNDPYETCGFIRGEYYLITAQAGQSRNCDTASPTSVLGNFVLQITMTILTGLTEPPRVGSGSAEMAGAGPVFRVNLSDHKQFYKVSFDSEGMWYLGASGKTDALPGAQCGQPCSYFRTGLNQPNVLTVRAFGASLDLWVNGHLIDVDTDSTYSHAGYLGVQLTSDTQTSSSVAFSNLRVWQL